MPGKIALNGACDHCMANQESDKLLHNVMSCCGGGDGSMFASSGQSRSGTLVLVAVLVKEFEIASHEWLVSAPHGGREYKLIHIPATAFLLQTHQPTFHAISEARPSLYTLVFWWWAHWK
jgi:hypothetical protein